MSESVTLNYLDDDDTSMSASSTQSTTYTADTSLSLSEDASGGAGIAKRPFAKKKPAAKPWQPPKRGKARALAQVMKKPATRRRPFIPYVRHGDGGRTTRPSRVSVSQSLRDVYTASDLQLVKALTASGHLQDTCFFVVGVWGHTWAMPLRDHVPFSCCCSKCDGVRLLNIRLRALLPASASVMSVREIERARERERDEITIA